MGDTGSGNPPDGQQMIPGHMMQQTPNFYEFPQNQGKGERAACGSDIGMGNMDSGGVGREAKRKRADL